jgi:antitoxin ParD1/3/4
LLAKAARASLQAQVVLSLLERKTAAMANTKAISVELGAQQASLQRHLESGHYDNASEVIRDALRALDQRDAVFDEMLRAQVLASMANKRPRVAAADVFKRLEARHVRRAKAAKRAP